MNLFHLDEDKPSFEGLGQTNGGKFWYARDFVKMLGYESYQAFQKPINKAIATCTALNIPVVENFEQVRREIGGGTRPRHKAYTVFLLSCRDQWGRKEAPSSCGAGLLRNDG
jgi:DNA-damage-inducible protein D